MDNVLSKEEVLHVAKLARIKVDEKDISKYQYELAKLLDDVNKINEVKGYDDDIMISPSEEKCSLRDDQVDEMIDAKEVIKNAPRHSGNYIEVPVIINE